MSVKAVIKTVYFSSLKNKHYQTRRAAIHADARGLLERKHPSEKYESDTGYGFYWKNDMPRSDVLFRRVCRLIEKSIS